MVEDKGDDKDDERPSNFDQEHYPNDLNPDMLTNGVGHRLQAPETLRQQYKELLS